MLLEGMELKKGKISRRFADSVSVEKREEETNAYRDLAATE